MQLSVSRYRAMLTVEMMFLITDIVINTTVEMFRFQSVILLVIFVIQDVCLIFSIIIVFLSFFSTYVFQAGLIGYLLSKFRASIFVSLLYLVLSITYHVWSLNIRWYSPMSYWWTEPLLSFFVIHRLVGCIYYYLYKRTALMITDPRLYEDISWIKEEWKLK